MTSVWLDYITREKGSASRMQMCYTMDVEGFISGLLYSHGIFEIPVTSFYNIEKGREQRLDLNSTTYAQKLECSGRYAFNGNAVA